jgi:hypothetical protein
MSQPCAGFGLLATSPDIAAAVTNGDKRMGIWIELGVFLIALAFGVWQLIDVRRAQAETRARKAMENGDPPPP